MKESWKIVNEIKQGCEKSRLIPNIMNCNYQEVEGDENIANGFNRFFADIPRKILRYNDVRHYKKFPSECDPAE